MMQILTKQDVQTGKVFANIILTKEELEKLTDGGVVTGEEAYIAIQIVGYGDDTKESENARE